MRNRRSAAVFAAVLLAHIGIAVAWLATHPPPRFLEPVTMQIELIRPPHLRPPPKPTRTSPPIRLHLANPSAPPTVAPLIAPPPRPAATAPAGPHILSDEELLAGPKPSIQQLRDAPVGGGISGAPLKPCKPAGERTANDPSPPCPVMADTPAGRAKREIKAYKDRYGPGGLPSANDYPSLRCRFTGSHCAPGDPSMDPLRRDRDH